MKYEIGYVMAVVVEEGTATVEKIILVESTEDGDWIADPDGRHIVGRGLEDALYQYCQQFEEQEN